MNLALNMALITGGGASTGCLEGKQPEFDAIAEQEPMRDEREVMGLNYG
jgi:hypothetical protein